MTKPKIKKPGSLTSLPAAPKTLRKFGAARWKDIGGELLHMKLLDRIDLVALEQLCMAFDVQSQCEAMLSQQGPVIANDRGHLVPHPAVKILSGVNKEIADYLKALGMMRKYRQDIDPLPNHSVNTVSTRPR